LRDTGKQQAGSSNSQQNQQQQQPSIKLLSPSLAKILYKRTLKSLASLPLAIGELFLLAGLSAIGTIIEQNKSVQFYQDAYPSGANKVLGFLTYHWIFALQWDHIYTAPYFLGLMALLGASLAACTTTRQLPMVRVARRYTSIRHLLTYLMQDILPLSPSPPTPNCMCHAPLRLSVTSVSSLTLSKVSSMYLAGQTTRPSLSFLLHRSSLLTSAIVLSMQVCLTVVVLAYQSQILYF